MPAHHVSASARIAAPPEAVYRVLADYRDGHPAILPPRYFGPVTVERGGVGAGTEIRFSMRVAGRERPMRAVVSEPEPGRRLVETDPDSGAVTTFTVEPDAGGAAALVTIATALPTHGGLLGILERALASRFLRQVYTEELALLAARAGGPNG